MSFTLWDIIRALLMALRWTALLSVVAFIMGGVVGLILLWLRISRVRTANWFARGYIELFQGTPLLMQLFMIFFGLALFGLDVPAWLAAGIGLTLWSSAFLSEIWRGTVESIAKGQWEASASLAMTRLQQMRYVILPQALRIAIAPTVGFCVQIVKGTAVTSIIGFVEVTKAGTMITNATFQPFETYGIVAALYFALCWPLSLYSRFLEKKFHAPHHH
ncbi:amino acid ABC transporter permease [Robbsia andropogonis]|uniref:Amino acid ABC transporter permease n=1 Tax=Robbsia andropogonis TaxID=28092 RepID=A0A0F5K0S7_9BURK|nr:amino acid ABC transporter permease [Robbsia andropogonis]KKB63489.1 amino acid ABC transporter permease [Robbsia andropogonis]MCP1116902.1 amino acid ABC transporter permease [Robbsia andropogonis]MCP1126419.1 amino acid ABC transporter permease [Robbsia andropogonis]